MKIGLIDVDGHNFPNLPLMKLSAWHKSKGHQVEWYEPLIGGHYDKVYMSKVFSFSPDYEYPINADEVSRGGSGYCIELVDGREIYHKEHDKDLPDEIEHCFPDYSIYNISDTAHGFMTRGCPRGCDFCIVKDKEGRKAHTVAPLSEFWDGQKNIILYDPNPIAAPEWRQNLQQLIDSKAMVEFNQGVDIRMMTEEKAMMLKQIRLKMIHFAWDRMQDGEQVMKNLKLFTDVTGWERHKVQVYVLTNFDTDPEQDLERIYKLKEANVSPYVMIYDKEHLPKHHILRKVQRWANNKFIFNSVERFEDYWRK